MNEEIIYGRWEDHHCCADCNTFLKNDEIYHHFCPYCGAKTKSMMVPLSNRPRRPVYLLWKIFGIIPWKIFIRYDHLPNDADLQSRG